MDDKDISNAVIARLPRYYRYLGELKNDRIERVSSRELSRLMHVTASQIRQDFNNFGGFGQQGYGYNVDYLYDEIGKILGLDHIHNMIIIGAGNLGQALVGYMNFKNRGFVFRGAFDISQNVIGKKIGSIEVLPLDDMPVFVRNNNIDIAVLTVPKTAAAGIAKELVECRIKAIWNFAHIDLPVPDSIKVENVHLSDSLMKLSYNLHRSEDDTNTTGAAE